MRFVDATTKAIENSLLPSWVLGWTVYDSDAGIIYLELFPALSRPLNCPRVYMPRLAPARVPAISLVRAVYIQEREVIPVLDRVMSLRGPFETLLVWDEYMRYLHRFEILSAESLARVRVGV
jgi:hypothetical protein